MAVEVPTPSGPARPDLKILETRIYRGPNVWSYQPAIHLVVDLGSLEDYPTDSLPGFTDRLVELVPGSSATPARSGAAAASSSGCARAPGSVTSPSTSPCSCRRWPATTRAAARPARSRAGPASYNVIYGYTDETVGVAAGKLAVRLVNHLVEAEDGFDFETELDAFLRQAERVGLRPLDRGHPRGGGVARHPLHPPQLGLARPARPGRARRSASGRR